MSRQSWPEVIAVYPQGSTLTAAAEALLVSDVVIPAGYMVPGRVLKISLTGKASNAVTTPGTLTIKVRWGGISGTVLVTSAALTQNTAAQTDKTWMLDVYVACITVGTSGSFLTWGTMRRGNCAVGAVGDITPDMLPADSLAAVTVDTTTEKNLSVTATPSLATASITAMSGVLESMN